MEKLISKKLTNITTNKNKPYGIYQGAFIILFSRSCQEKNYIFLHLTFGLTVRYAYTNDGRRELMEG